MLKKIKYLILVLALLFDVFVYFTAQPAINIHSYGFWVFVLICVIPFLVLNIDFKANWKTNVGIIIFSTSLVLALLVANMIGTPLLGGLKNYQNRIAIPESSDFSEIDEFDKTQVQIVDKNISMSLADRVFGEMGADVVSQYQMSNNYASIVVDNTMYRITPVEYSGFIKWLSTRNNGTPGFIAVNVTTGDTVFHELENGLKYTENAKLLNNLDLHLRLKYPFEVLGQTKFEVDDDWNPYWVTEVLDYKFIGKCEDVKGVIVTNPVNGDTVYYDVDEVPSWIDNVYNANLISHQYNSYGEYVNGLFNFSQKGKTAVTDDYAYLQKNGHLWMYTGITSIGTDESNVGFIYVDLQNKNVIYIISAGAEEYSARASAEGAVQEKGYSSVFPTIVNIDGEPVYFMGLKDNAGLIKSYAFVAYKNYQKVGIGVSVEEALKNFTGKAVVNIDKTEKVEIVVKQIASAVVDGNSMYFIETSDDNYYRCSIEISDMLPFVKEGDKLSVAISENMIVQID